MAFDAPVQEDRDRATFVRIIEHVRGVRPQDYDQETCSKCALGHSQAAGIVEWGVVNVLADRMTRRMGLNPHEDAGFNYMFGRSHHVVEVRDHVSVDLAQRLNERITPASWVATAEALLKRYDAHVATHVTT